MADSVIEVRYHAKFLKWRSGLRDMAAKMRVAKRIRQIEELGNFGDQKWAGGGVWEMRVNCGPGYRLYYTRRGEEVIMLLCGGNKSTQSRDIKLAKKLAKEAQDGWMGQVPEI